MPAKKRERGFYEKKDDSSGFPVVIVFFACGLCFAIGPGDLQDLTGFTPADLAN